MILRIIAGLAVALAVFTTPVVAGTPEEWRQDIDRMVLDIRGTHPQPFANIGERTFLREAEAFKAEVPSLTEPQRMVRAMRLVASLGDGHTRLEPDTPAFARWYPIRLYEFTDGYFVTSAHDSVADLAGAQVLEVGGRPVAEAAAQARTLFGADNRFDAMERLYALHNAVLMQGLGYADEQGDLAIRVRLANGRVENRRLTPMTDQVSRFDWIFRPEFWGPVGLPEQWVTAYRGLRVSDLRTEDSSRPAHLMHRRAHYARALPDQNAYYIQVNIVGNSATESLPAFFRRALAEVDAMRPRHLIVDLRYNFGGDGSNVPDVISQFVGRGENPPWTNLYVVSGRRTFSAGVMLLAGFMDQTQATTIGEPPGAVRNHFGDAKTFNYPSSGMRLYVSTVRHTMGDANDLDLYMPVDVPARFAFADYAGGRDPAVDLILAGQEMRGIAAVAMAEGGQAAAQVYRERVARFADLEWWSPPSEIELRTVMRSLRDRGQLDQAISVAELNTVVNPSEWRTWFNLGDALMAAQRRDEAMEAYRRSVALGDPTNFNAERLTQLLAEYDRERAQQAPAAAPSGGGQ